MKCKCKRQAGYIVLGLFAIWLTSCMGDGANEITYNRLGVVQTQPWKCIFTSDGYMISSPDFEARQDVKEGDCCLVDYRTNFSEELGNGVYDAKILKYDSVATWSLSPVLIDTALVLDGEQTISVQAGRTTYMQGYLFLFTQHNAHLTNQKDLFNLSYDPKQIVKTDENGKRIYDLFLRVTKEGGEKPEQSSLILPNAFSIRKFIEEAGAVEKEAGQSTLHFKVNYTQRFNEDTTACIWAADTVAIRFN